MIPSGVPHEADVPYGFPNIIALVPWISQDCTKSYLVAVNNNLNNNLASALITYVPNNSTDAPPPVNDEQWFLNDGGRWKSESEYPVYAIPGASGSAIMQQLNIYSGDIRSIRNGSFLSIADPNDYIRLYTSIETNAHSNLPSLWAFLLMVLGIVLILVGLTSCAMHYHQRRARRSLRRRVAAGEIDLESLGVRRLTVPQDVLDKLPVHLYIASEKERPVEGSAPITQLSRRNSAPAPVMTTGFNTVNMSEMPQTFSQPMCAICLDDFVPNSTMVKELPCRHIYHPECIDELLKAHSSLCPVCKGKVLPIGYCPEMITNAMVRRERQARRLPRQRADLPAGVVPSATTTTRRQLAVGGRMASFHRQFGRVNRLNGERRIFSAPEPQAVEMNERSANSDTTVGNPAAVPPLPSQQPVDRTERARRRVSALLRNQVLADDDERERWERLPKCMITLSSLASEVANKTFLGRKAVGSVFPGFR